MQHEESWRELSINLGYKPKATQVPQETSLQDTKG